VVAAASRRRREHDEPRPPIRERRPGVWSHRQRREVGVADPVDVNVDAAVPERLVHLVRASLVFDP